MKKKSNNVYINSQKEGHKYIQHTLFDLEAKDTITLDREKEANRILSQDNQITETNSEFMISDRIHEIKGYYTP